MNKKRIGLIGISLILIYMVAGAFILYQPNSVLDYPLDEYNREEMYDSDVISSNSNTSSTVDSSNKSRDSELSDTETIIVLCFGTFALIGMVSGAIYDHKNKKKKKEEALKDKERYNVAANHAANKEVQKYFPELTREQLQEILFKKFIDIQVAEMNFDYKKLEKLCTDELYNSIKEELDELKTNNQQRIMKDFEIVTFNLNGISEENDIVIIRTFLHMISYDYVIDSKTKEIVKGTDTNVVHSRCALNFIVKRGETLTECPSCGAKIKPGDSECDYCHTIIINNYGGFILNSCNWTN